MASKGADFGRLAEGLLGKVLRPGDPGYDDARRVHNGMIDRRPAAIARCAGVADVAAAVRFAGEHGLEVAVRGGGHNVAGRSVCEGGLMIDLAGMKGIWVDPEARTARAQAGVVWGELNRETMLHGLATTGGAISSTGIAGLTLGGGIGYLMGTLGLTIDNLLSAEVVAADGRVLRAAADENEDLFWALRGGGGNFGVVTSFEYRLHPVGPEVTGGVIAWPYAAARDVLRHFRELTASAPDELTAFAGLLFAPDGSGARLAAIIPGHSGPLEAGAKALAATKGFGKPVMDAVGPMPYEALNMMLDAGWPRGALNYWKTSLLAELSDGVIDTMIERFASCPAPLGGVLIEHVHGAVTRVAPDATAFAHRAEFYNFLIAAQWTDPSISDACVAWARETHAAMEPYYAAAAYMNYLGDDEGKRSPAAYGGNLERLREVKRRYDPGNVFHLNQNIAP